MLIRCAAKAWANRRTSAVTECVHVGHLDEDSACRKRYARGEVAMPAGQTQQTGTSHARAV